MNTLLKLGLVAGAALALSACGSGRPSADAPSPSRATPIQAPAPVVAPSPTESTVPAPAMPSASPPRSPAASVDPCPVSERTLLKALKGTDAARRGGDATHLVRIKCYRGYAVARNGAPRPGTDAGYYLFGYRRPQNVWVALNTGTADYCEGYVLDGAVRQRLEC
jgi:hypothetical protein